MINAPLLRPVRTSGGTLYVFPSANADIAKTFGDDDARFVFDKYILLDLPDIKTPVNESNDIVWENIGAAGTGISSIPVPPGLYASENFNFAVGLQNYAMNFESLILSGQNSLAEPYDNSTFQTVSERVFWKFLKEINAVRFSETVDESNISGRYVERRQTEDAFYNQVVKCVGDISIVNNVNRDGAAYTEVYIHVPTNSGSTPDILFKTFQDNNYRPGVSWIGDDEFISGRSSTTIHPSGLDYQAWYDDDPANSYQTSATFTNITDTIRTVQLSGGSTKDVKISNLDGIMVDFDLDNYTRATDNSVLTFDEFNTLSSAGNFDFNAVMIYYSVFDASNPSNSVRNLYGILLLDEFQSTTSGSFIQRFDKEKPNQLLGASGNSYSFKLNIKFDSYSENVAAETVINDYNTFSLELFTDLMIRLQDANDNFAQVLEKNEQLFNEVEALKDLLTLNPTNAEIEQQLIQLQESINNSITAASTNEFTLDLINQTNQRINDIINGNIAINTGIDTTFLDFGPGILLDRTIPNKVKVINSQQQYQFSVCENDSGSLDATTNNGIDSANPVKGNIITSGPFGFQYRELSALELFDNLRINIKDPEFGWKKGQSFKIIFTDEIILNGYFIQLFSDSKNLLQANKNYSKQIVNLTESDLLTNRPIIEVTCFEPSTFQFVFDVIR